MPSSRARADDPDGDLAPVGDQDLRAARLPDVGGVTGCGPHLAAARAGTVERRRASPTEHQRRCSWPMPIAAPTARVLVADHQTAGRGRLDRRWDAPADANLLVSLLFHRAPPDPGAVACDGSASPPSTPAATLGRGSTTCGPEVAQRPARSVARSSPGCWPNVTPTGRSSSGWASTCGGAPDGAARLGDDVDPADLLAALLDAYDRRRPPTCDERYRAELSTLGRRVRVELPCRRCRSPGPRPTSTVDGRLVVLDDSGATHRLAVGDVVHLRTA